MYVYTIIYIIYDCIGINSAHFPGVSVDVLCVHLLFYAKSPDLWQPWVHMEEAAMLTQSNTCPESRASYKLTEEGHDLLAQSSRDFILLTLSQKVAQSRHDVVDDEESPDVDEIQQTTIGMPRTGSWHDITSGQRQDDFKTPFVRALSLQSAVDVKDSQVDDEIRQIIGGMPRTGSWHDMTSGQRQDDLKSLFVRALSLPSEAGCWPTLTDESHDKQGHGEYDVLGCEKSPRGPKDKMISRATMGDTKC